MEVEEDVGLLEGRGVEVKEVVSGSKHNKSARALGILLGGAAHCWEAQSANKPKRQ